MHNHSAPLYRYKWAPVLRKQHPHVLKQLTRMAKRKAPREAVLRYIIYQTSEAELQYHFLMFFYKQAGIKAPGHHKYSPLSEAEKKAILEMFQRNFSVYSIAKHLGRHVSTIYYYLKRHEGAKPGGA